MYNASSIGTPPHLARYYRQVFALLAAQNALARAVWSDHATDAELEEAEIARNLAFGRVFGLSVWRAREMAATIPHDEMAATIPHTGEDA